MDKPDAFWRKALSSDKTKIVDLERSENLWIMIKASFVWHPDQPTKLNKLYHVCQEEWTHIQPVLCLRLIGGYHEHVAKKLGDI